MAQLTLQANLTHSNCAYTRACRFERVYSTLSCCNSTVQLLDEHWQQLIPNTPVLVLQCAHLHTCSVCAAAHSPAVKRDEQITLSSSTPFCCFFCCSCSSTSVSFTL
jgi:hypothetical protein